MYTLSQLFNGFYILYDYLYIFVVILLFEHKKCKLTKISHQLQVLWISHFKGGLYLYNNQLTGTLTTEMWNMYDLSKLFFTRCLSSLMDFAFCMSIWKNLLWIYYLKMKSLKWPKYFITCMSCDFLISKLSCIYQITN